jgi:hypothetical protein
VKGPEEPKDRQRQLESRKGLHLPFLGSMPIKCLEYMTEVRSEVPGNRFNTHKAATFFSLTGFRLQKIIFYMDGVSVAFNKLLFLDQFGIHRYPGHCFGLWRLQAVHHFCSRRF